MGVHSTPFTGSPHRRQVALVMQEFGVGWEGTAAPFAGLTPSQPLVEPPTAVVACKDPQPRSLDAPSPNSLEYRVVGMLGDPSAPVLDRYSEVQELVVTHSGEANDGTIVEHHEAVDPRRGDLLEPTLGDGVPRKRVGILWENLGETDDCARRLNIEHLRNIPSRHLA
jgi:hypothetical protein